MIKTLLTILVLAPFLGFLVNGFNFRNTKVVRSGVVGSVAVLSSFLASLALFSHLWNLPEPQRVLKVVFFNWISVDQLIVDFGFTLDPLSLVMVLIITGVGFLIHVFSISYMEEDPRPSKYFSFLNLFIFNMLLLVLGSNLLVMFIGWEGVGLSSYLLIGFWFSDAKKSAAGMKAFIVNRLGDVGLLLGMFLLYNTFNTLDFSLLTQRVSVTESLTWFNPVNLACLFLFLGATGKSAQIPLYVWLPDAMAGPTPVSALIHAATMVTAGIYMIIRMNGVFIVAPNIMMLIAVVGAFTALGAATIALVQTDIKKILAYSTISQLGYMFLAVGTGAFLPAMFHLITHAFFKALLFLGAGSIIHSLKGEQNIKKMGGLKAKMPITYFTFLMGWLAIIGAPFFSGFFSKDEVLWYSYASEYGHPLLWVVGVVTAGCTAFYMTRLVALVFWGTNRNSDLNIKESSLPMTFPLLVLSVLSVFSGVIGLPHWLGNPPNFLEIWLKPLILQVQVIDSLILELSLMGISVSLTAIMSVLAYTFYVRSPEKREIFSGYFRGFYRCLYSKYYLDDFYENKIVQPIIYLGKNLWIHIDIKSIDKVTYRVTHFIRSCACALKSIQDGNMQNYAMYMGLGLGLIISYVLTSHIVFLFFIAVVFLCLVISSFLLKGK